jgi:bifunctional enzyme CysN/CysC
VIADPYARNRVTGAFILIDESNNDTVAGGMVAG